MEKTVHLKRLAIQIAAQLPDDVHEARSVLRYASELVENFLKDGEPQPPVLRAVS